MFRPLITSLEANLNDYELCIVFINNSSQLRPRLYPIISWGNLDEDSRQLLQSFISSRFDRPALIYCALFVAIHATFEQYIRDLVEEAIRKMNKAINKFEKLDDVIAKNNIKFSGSILTTIHEPLDYYKFDYHDICRAIGTCFPGSSNIRLNPAAFSFAAGAMTTQNIEKLLRRIKLSIDWDAFGKDASIQRLFDSHKTRATTEMVKNYIEDMVRIRNRIAHTGAAVTEIDSPSLTMQINVIKLICNILTNYVAKYLTREFQIRA